MPETAVIIPARWGSTRFPGKPLHPIAGKPLLQHVWERACRARGISQVIVATDDERIARAAREFGAEVAMTSPEHPSGTDRIAEVVAERPEVGAVINVQGDEPLINPGLISALAAALAEDPALEMVTVANEITDEEEMRNPNVVKVVLGAGGRALYFSRSPIPYTRGGPLTPGWRHQGIYGYTRALVLRFVQWAPSPLEQREQLEQLRALENGVALRVLQTPHRSLGVDAPEDIAPVERLLALA